MLDTKALAKALAPVVKEHVESLIAPLRAQIEALKSAPVRDGKDGIDGRDGVDGKDGTSVTLEDVLPALQKQVEEFLATIPAPKDGKDGEPGAPGKDGEPGAPGERGRDGLDVKDLFRADGGRLMAVMSDGTTKDLGVFVGSDGKDGAPGADGKDGVGFDDLTVEFDGERTATLKFSRGENVKEFPIVLPVVLDRGVFKDGSAYVRGDGVTWGGSFWIAQKDTKAKPGEGPDWRLAVKKGRDGKEVVKTEPAAKPVKVG
jgi:hypothetical protein